MLGDKGEKMVGIGVKIAFCNLEITFIHKI